MDVTTYDRMDRISAAGYGYGYIGSVFPFVLFMMIMQFSGLNSNAIVSGWFLHYSRMVVYLYGSVLVACNSKIIIEKPEKPIKESFMRFMGND